MQIAGDISDEDLLVVFGVRPCAPRYRHVKERSGVLKHFNRDAPPLQTLTLPRQKSPAASSPVADVLGSHEMSAVEW